MVRGLVEHEHVRPRVHEHGEREPPQLAAGEAVERLLHLVAREQEAPEEGARLAGREAGGPLRGGQHRAPAGQLLRVLGHVAEGHLVAGLQLPGGQLAPAHQGLDQGGLPAAVPAHERHVLAALDPQRGVLDQRAAGHLDPAALQLEHHPPRALRVGEGERQLARVPRVALDPVHLLQPLDARLRLARLGRLRAEALDEPLQPRDLRLLLLDRPAERQLPRRLLLAPRVPGAGEEPRAPGLELQHRGAHGLEEPAVVRHEHDRRVEARQVLLEPLERGDVEVVGGLVEQQQVRLAGERAGERRARELAAREGRQPAVEILGVEAQAAQGHERAVAPAVAAVKLEALLGLRVRAEGRLVVRAVGHRLLKPRQLALERGHLLRARQHVVAQAQVSLARRALVVQRHLRRLLDRELAPVDGRVAGQHPQQRGLARPVAPGQRHPVAALELERHAPQQRAAGDVLPEVRCDHYGHGEIPG